MIPGSAHASQPESWQKSLKSSCRDVKSLLKMLNLSAEDLPWPVLLEHEFPLRAPQSYIENIKPGCATDPLLLQILPFDQEELEVHGFAADPLQEKNASVVPGLLHKYQGRVLIITTAACGIHCRYCFRKEFPYGDHRFSHSHWQQVMDYIRADSSIEEVIFSGGDPLVLSDSELKKRLDDIASIDHVTTIRFHSRLAAILPQRLTKNFIEMLRVSRLSSVLVLHCNHAQELNIEALALGLASLRSAGVLLLNQTVLLRQVNDATDVLSDLSKTLFKLGVLPYYLHLLDKVSGTAHFEVPESKALNLYEDLLSALPGYMVPKLVREVPGVAHKKPVHFLS